MSKQSFLLKSYNYNESFDGVNYGTYLRNHDLITGCIDDKESLKANFRKLHGVEGVVYLKQTHGNIVHQVNHKISTMYPLEGDGLVTHLNNIALLSFHADCQVVFIIDRYKRAVGIIHAGFRGQIKRIYFQAIRKMQDVYDIPSSDLKVIFAPSLCQKHAEFKNYEEEFPEELWKYKNSNHFFDLKMMAKQEFLDAGVEESSIFLNPDCTYEDEKIYFSYRKSKTQQRHVSYIILN